MKQLIIILTILLLTTKSFGQSNDLQNREPFTLKLAVDSINSYESEIKASPFLLPDKSIHIYPGEKIYVEIELNGREIKSIKTVKTNLNPGKTLVISFEQAKSGIIHEMMMLRIENPFNYKLDYKVKMFLMKYKKWVPTNVLTISPKLSAFETWADILVTLSLSGWKFKQ